MSHHLRMYRRMRLAIDALESRDVPAGAINATLAGGLLRITGDDADNGLQALVAGNNVTLTPDATTQINGRAAGEAVSLAGPTRSLSATLRDGNDTFSIVPTADFILSGFASFDMGDGDNTLTLVQDPATEELLRIGSLIVRGADGFDAVSINGGIRGTSDDPGGPQFSFVRSIALQYGDGGSDTTLGSGYFGQLSGGVTMTSGDGPDDVHFQHASVTNLAIAGGLGVLRVSGEGGGAALYITGEEVEFDLQAGSFGGFPIGAFPVTIIGLSRAAVTLGEVGFFAPLTVQALRRDGVATVEVAGPHLQMLSGPPFASLAVRSGGSAAFVVRPGSEFEINGRVNVAAGLGDAEFRVDGGRALVNGPLSVTSSGGDARVVQTGSSEFRLQQFNFLGAIGQVANLTVSAFKNAGVELTAGQADVGGAMSLSGLTAARLIQTGSETDTVIRGSLRLSGGTSDAQLDASGRTLLVKGNTTMSAPSQSVLKLNTNISGRLEGNVAIFGGSKLDELSANANARFLKHLSVNLGNGGGSVSLDPGAAISGNLTVNGGNGADYIALKGIGVGGATRIVTGAGADTLNVDLGTVFGGTFYADLGSGADTIALAQSVGSAGPVTFTGKATIFAGNGNDTLLLGKAVSAGGDATSKVVFGAAALNSINGGLGLNSFDDEAAQFQLIGVATLSTPSWTDPMV